MVRAWLTTRSRGDAANAYTTHGFPPIVISRWHGWGYLLVGLRRAIPRHFGRAIDAPRGGPGDTSPVVARIKRWSTRLWRLWPAVVERIVFRSILHPW